ncbi:M16 family metallopeptidase [Pseudomonas sp. HLS-6 TE3448]
MIKKTLRWALACLAPGLPLLATASEPAPLQHFTLDNGLQVILREDRRAPLVESQLWYHVGSSYEYPGQSGLSHALEHLMFEGSSKIGPGQIAKIFARIGATENAFTTHDATVFHQTLPSDRLAIALEAAADAMETARLGATEYAREIEVVKAERRRRVDNAPIMLAQERVQAHAYAQSSYRTPTIGWANDLEQMRVEELRQWYRDWYVPNNATLVVVGDVSLETLKPMVERYFGAIARRDTPVKKVPREQGSVGERRLDLRLPQLEPGLILAFNVPSAATAEAPHLPLALRLIPQILTEGFSSRMNAQLIRHEKMLSYVQSSYEPYRRGDTLLTLDAFPNPTTQPALADVEMRIWEMLEALKSTPPTAAELARAKARLIASQVYVRDELGAQADAIGEFVGSGLPLTYLNDEIQALQAVTAEDVQHAAQSLLTRERLTIAHLQAKEADHE